MEGQRLSRRGLIQLAFQGPVDFLDCLSLIIKGKREQSDLAQNCAGAFGDNFGFLAMLLHTDPDMAEADEIQTSRDLALSEESLTGLNADEGKSLPKIIHDPAVFVLLDAIEQIRIL